MNPVSEGQAIPQATFITRENGEWTKISSDDVFKGKNVVVFALPGAYTPTCSTSHVPRYHELADQFKELGVDEIVCISVNDTFVMEAWKETQHADNIRFLPDGNGEFTEKMGMLVGKEDLGFGKRSWRYSMLVKDGVIDKLFIEKEVPGDPYDVSDADTMLNYLGGDSSKQPDDVLLFTKKFCAHCARAKKLLDEKGIAYSEVESTPRMLRAVSDIHTTPQVFINGKHVGTADDLEKYYS